MNNSFNIVRIVFAVVFGIYELLAFKNKRPLKYKLFPIVFMILPGILIMAATSFTGFAILYFMSAVLLIELSLTGSMIVILLEACTELFRKRNVKKLIFLTGALILLAFIYYSGQKVF